MVYTRCFAPDTASRIRRSQAYLRRLVLMHTPEFFTFMILFQL